MNKQERVFSGIQIEKWGSAYFYTLSTSILFTCFWTDLVRVLATTRVYNTRKFKGINSREITSFSEIKKVIYMHVISIIAENKPHARHKTICIQWKFTTPDNQFC